MERFSRDSAHLKHSNTCPRFSNSKTLAFPTEELESNAKCSSFGGGGGGGGGSILSMSEICVEFTVE